MTRSVTRLLTLVLALSVVFTACGGSATGTLETVSANAASDIIGEPGTVLLDIRTPAEFADARIDGAINIDFYAADFADQIAALDRDGRYVVYCRSGNRSGQAMGLFRDLGFTDVHEIGSGILSWMQSGLPTISG